MAYEFKSPGEIAPFATLKGESFYRVQGADRQISGARHLFFASSAEDIKTMRPHGVPLEGNAWFATGTFRNSLFIEPLVQFTTVREMYLIVEYQGSLRCKVMCAGPRRGVEVMADVKLFSATRTRFVLYVGNLGDLPERCRLFWHVEAGSGGGTFFDANWCTTNAPLPTCRMLVAMRTFGRTGDIKGLLKRFADGAARDPFYAAVLANMEFWVLDTTEGCEDSYPEPYFDMLNLRVLKGPNLGGGGNAGHMLQLLEEAAKDAAAPPTELLVLDDDLSVSMESLARYFMFTAYRAAEVITSLPVLMKSRPTVVWEDGGFWGRLNFHENGDFSRKRNLFPNLLKHGMELNGFGIVDEFCPLNTCEYATFIFYGLSIKTLRKLGLPAAFFLRGDDIELSLRAQQLGVTLYTNSNLAAWHEPAHSYGQEYMAILHGVIINLTYGDHGADFYCRFFEERLYEHSCIGDVTGMKLYMSILSELLDKDSLVLSPEFQKHYLVKLKELAGAKMWKLPDADQEAFDRKARESKTLIVPFVYPGYRKEVSGNRTVMVVNPSMRTYREVAPVALSDKLALVRSFVDLIDRLGKEFEAVRGRWQERLATASTPAYWKSIAQRYADQTKELYAGAAALSTHDESDVPVSDNPRPDGRGTAKAGAGRASWAGVEVAVTPVADPYEAAGLPGSDASGLPKEYARLEAFEEALPPDFDPSVYAHINQDVRDAGIDPAEHYMKFGRQERRRYRL